MADNNVEFEIRMKDEATKVFSNFKANISTQSVAVQQAFQGIQRSSGDATQTLIGFNRVIQDAPYGIMGIANNLNPLYESFVRLKNETGSTSGAFSAMTSALTGPAGVGIAIAAVSSLAVTFGKDMFQSADISQKKLNDLKLEAIDLKVKLGELTLAQAANRWNDEISKAEVSLFRLKQTTTDWQKTMMTQGRYGAIQKTVGTPEEIQQAQNDIDTMKGKILDLYKAIQDKDTKSSAEFATKQAKEEYEKFLSWMRSEFGSDNSDNPLFNSFKPEFLEPQLKVSKQLIEDNDKDAYNKREELNKKAIERNKWAVQQMAEDYKKGVQEQIEAEKTKYKNITTVVSAAGMEMARSMRDAFEGSESALKSVLRATLNAIISAVEAQLIAAKASSIAQGIISGGFTAFRDIPALIAGTAALEAARLAVNKMHNGGTVGNFQSQPAGREFPILVRGGETVRTEGQERDLQNRIGGSGMNVTININGDGLSPRAVQMAVIAGMRQTGQTVDKYFVNQRSGISLS